MEVVATSKIDQIIDQQVQAGKLDIVTAFLGELERAESLRMGMEMDRVSEDAESGSIRTPLTSSPTKVEDEKDISIGDHLLKRIKLFVYDFFKKYAKQYKDRCTPHDFPALMRDMVRVCSKDVSLKQHQTHTQSSTGFGIGQQTHS